MRFRALFGVSALAVVAAPANAAITFDQALITQGQLVVTGNAGGANVRVTLDGVGETVSGPDGTFEFRLIYPGERKV